MNRRGFFAIGIWHGKSATNIGTLWRSANLFGAAFVFTIGRRYERQCSDTMKTPLHIPLLHFADVDDLHKHLPWNAPLIGVEMDARSRTLSGYGHPLSAVYLLGAEDHGLSPEVRARCHSLIQIETARDMSMNVSAAGSIVMHHRHAQRAHQLRTAA